MSKKVVTRRRELLDRWRAIQEEDDDCDDHSFDHSKQHHLRHLKETWFSDAFNFLIYLPRENHIWCGSWDLMGPLLETFYNYFKDGRQDSPLKPLWKRICEELQECMQCVFQHHQAKDTYMMEYELSSIGPLLDVLCTLDEARVTNQLKEMNARISMGKYDPVKDNARVICVMYEVLMFPELLDDQSLVSEFQIFIEAIDDSHELALAGHQQYPGVYALLFLKSRRGRSIGFRLAGSMGKLRTAADLDPLQPLLKKCIVFLETEVLPLNSERARPRMQLDRITVWLGIKALLVFLEPQAFEEGILEQYPSFLSIVLNHICDDSPEFSHAINCLRLLFEMLGCKLWLRAALSPSVMRDTLLGQCFHTRDEKSHKEIFDLFPPFLQSLEALQDGEHEKQRRHFIYFLLHQVTVSSNFSTLMRKKACQIALLIIHRGYRMNPSCPPFECAHMWGHSLVSSLKDSSLSSSLRQPAFDLIQAIIVSDAAALVSSLLYSEMHEGADKGVLSDLKDEEDCEGLVFSSDVEEKDVSCWNDFSVQGQTASREFGWWMCIPMLWFDVLLGVDPAVLPVSFSKAVLWALSRFSMVEPETSTEMALPVGHWLSTRASEISHLFGWKMPSGSNDSGDGKDSKNSIKVTTMCIPLIRTFRRLTSQFLTKMEQGELGKQWTWEPRMGESLILLLVDPDDNARQVGRRILEQVSNTQGLLSCLQFLCSCSASTMAVFLGLKHALKLLLVDPVLERYQSLHHFFFVLCKLLKEGGRSGQITSGLLSENQNMLKFSSQGGFLHQPLFDPVPNNNGGNLSEVDLTYWKKFCCLLSEIAWPYFCKCLVEGKAFIDYKMSQMTSIRLLEIIPVAMKWLLQPIHRMPGNSGILAANGFDLKWLHDLMYWGKSSLAVVVRYWKQTMLSLLDLLKELRVDNSTSTIMAIEELLQCETIPIDELAEQVSSLSICLMNDIYEPSNAKRNFKSKSLHTKGLWHEGSSSARKPETFGLEDTVVRMLDSGIGVKTVRESVVILSDDDIDVKDSVTDATVSHPRSSQISLDGNDVVSHSAENVPQNCAARNKASAIPSLENFHQSEIPDSARLVDLKLEANRNIDEVRLRSLVEDKSLQGTRKERSSVAVSKSCFKKSSEENISSKIVNSVPRHLASSFKKGSDEVVPLKSSDERGIKKVSAKSNMVIKEIVFDAEDDPWEFALKSARNHQSLLTKLNTGGPRRQVIQLNLPVENRVSHLNRVGSLHQRFKPQRLDEWFRSILLIDYFVTVGLASSDLDKNQSARKLKQVPVCFPSPDDYMEIFRPLVLEEFKAQLHSSLMEMASLEEMSCGVLSVLSVERVDDFHVVRCVHDDSILDGSKSCMENDLVLLTRQHLKKFSNDVHMVGKVERHEKDNKRKSSILVIKFYLQNGCSRLNRAKKLLMERSKWHIHHIMSITPQLREFQALSSIKSIPLLPVILNPSNQPSSLESRKDLSKLSQPLQQMLKSSFNESQLKAISSVIGSVDSRKDYDLSLIQGPPGTGKTRTIVAIVSALLSLSGSNTREKPENGGQRSRNTSFIGKAQISQSAAIARAWQDAALAKQLSVDEGRSCKAMASHTRGRVLICAQSNAAVDELVSRISNTGLYGSDGFMYKPYLVRVGNAKTVHPSSLPFFIDTLVDHRLMEEKVNAGDGENDVDGDSSTVLRSKLENLVDRIRFFEAKRANLSSGHPDSKCSLQGDAARGGDDVKDISDAEIGAKLKKLYSDKKAVYIDLSAAQAREKKANEERKALRHKLRKSILREAEIVITTLSGCGGDLYAVCSESILTHKFGSSSEYALFDAVVIDEAAQAVEPATLIPLQLLKSKGGKCIMVGDPKQLTATVLSNIASKYLYQCSMFERLQKAGHPVTMLTKQYRMHPEICRFPALHFYHGKLLNGDQMSSKEAPFHKTEGLGPYLFFDILDGQELHGNNSGSLYNECEADAAVELLRFFKKSYPSEFVGGRIGVITPYRSQLSLLRSRFSTAFGSCIMDEMELNTVDGFQGREVDILVLSTVRATEIFSAATKINNRNIGFVADVRRMNVALTRAKYSLWILGNVGTLQTNEDWGALVNDAKERNLVISVKKPYSSMISSLSKRNQVPESSFHVPRRMKPGKNTNKASKYAQQQENSNKSSAERKRGYPGAHRNRNVDEYEYTYSTKMDVNEANKKARKQYDSSAKKDHGSIDVENNISRISKDMKSAITEDKVTHKESWDSKSGEKQRFNRHIDMNKHSERSPHQGEGSRISSSSQVENPKDIICKRKQQREAIDALLPSALISSKRPESSSKSVPDKRVCPPVRSSGHAIRPSKSKKRLIDTAESEKDLIPWMWDEAGKL